MWRRIILWIIEKLYPLTYERVTLDKINSKLIRPVPNLIIDGVQYWEFVQIADMPETRRTHYIYIREEMTMGIERKDLIEYADEIMKANASNDLVYKTNRIATLSFMLKDTVQNITTAESLYNLASIAYFDPTEDLAAYDNDYAQLKIERFKRVPDKSFFFNRLLSEGLKISPELLPTDIQESFAKDVAKLKAYARMRSGNIE